MQHGGRMEAGATVNGRVDVHGTNDRASTITVQTGGDLQDYGPLEIGPYGVLQLFDASSNITAESLTRTGIGGSFNWTAGTMQITDQVVNLDTINPHSVLGSSLTIGAGKKLIVSTVGQQNDSLIVAQTGTGDLTIESGGKAESFRGEVGVFGTSDGSVVVRDPGASWNVTEQLRVGGEDSSHGQMSILNGGAVTADLVVIGLGNSSHGGVTVDGLNSTLNSTGELRVASQDMATGALTIQNQGVVTSALGSIGVYSGAPTGTLIVDGAGSSWNNTGNATVGNSTGGSGMLTVRNGGSATIGGSLFVEPTGTVELLGSEIHAKSFVVDPSGTFTHEDGTLTVDGGQFDPGIFDYTIEGTTVANQPIVRLAHHATASLHGHGFVGRNFTGRLEILDGSNVELPDNGSGGLVIGLAPGSEGSVLVEGAESSLTNHGITIGQVGHGELRVLNGGSITNSLPTGGLGETIGLFSGSEGLVEVSGSAPNGTPSSYSTNGSFWVGQSGRGTLMISAGGIVHSGGLTRIAILPGSAGSSATVTGSGSRWETAGSIYVGSPDATSVDTGTLTVEDTGRLKIDYDLRVWDPGTLLLTSDGEIHTGSFNVETGGTFIHEDGTLTVDGGTFNPGTTGYLLSGAAPTDEPTLELIGGATAAFTDVVQIGSTGAAAMKVTGDNSRFSSTHDFMDIGWIGSGRLEVLDKGVVDQTGGLVFNLGVAPGASGIVTVDGADSQIIAGGLIIVGDHGEGHFAVTGGARVTADRLWMTHYSDAQSSDMLVSGAAAPDAPSLLQISGSAFIGGEEAQGSGVPATLTVNDGGNVVVGDVLRVWPTGTIDLANGSVRMPNGFVSLSGGTLIGDGTIEGDLTNAGVLSPGHSAGAITIDGAYEQDPAGTLEIEIGGTSPTQFDQLQLTGDEVILAVRSTCR